LDQIPAIPPFTTLNTANIDGTLRGAGFLFGGQLGYGHGFANSFVAGIETDLQWSGIGAINRSNIVGLYYPPISTGFQQNSQLTIRQDWFGTTRLRLGFQAFDRGLIYATGGIAYSHFSTAISGAGEDPSFFIQSTTGGSGSSTRLGWAAGAGVEYAIAQNLSLKTEYLYSEYSGFSVPYQGSTIVGSSFGPPAVISTQGTLGSGTLGIHLLRAGLNWTLGDPGH
jgi:outer membrane immunogenic protein